MKHYSFHAYFVYIHHRIAFTLFFVAFMFVNLPCAFAASDVKRVKLFVKEVPITVYGKKVMVAAVQQADGTLGYSPEQKNGFHVELINQLTVPTTIHWHGLSLPNGMDGVPFVTQKPIPPGGSYFYDFPLKEHGTYWMHSHYALQEQDLLAAPMVIWTPEERAKANRQYVVTLSDFSFTPPDQILKNLQDAPAMNMKTDTTPRSGMEEMKGMKVSSQKQPLVITQAWDQTTHRFVRATKYTAPANIDVNYDALLANLRTMDHPEVMEVRPGESVLLRIIAASCALNFFIDTGSLDAELLAVDGRPVKPLRGNFFQLAIGQRIDVRVKIPKTGGAFPIIAQGEGSTLLGGVILASKGAAISALPHHATLKTASLDNLQDSKLRATHPLTKKKATCSLPAVLAGSMVGYKWSINGKAYPNHDALLVKKGDRVEITITNNTAMGHPMHLHDGSFHVVEINGKPFSGAERDTIEVPPHETVKIAFDALNPGVWAFHCHLLYHAYSGMFTVLKYEGADTKFWRPEKFFTQVFGL
jgi:FtsP/CotA-like multicopper oxidase with cupredoxin domain